MQNKIKIGSTMCLCKDEVVTVKFSHLIDCKYAKAFCNQLKHETGDRYKRSAKSWAVELIAHNILYKANMFKIHVVDTDLEEHEKWHRLVGYRIIYWLYLTQTLFERLKRKEDK